MLVRWTDFDDAFRTLDLFSDMSRRMGDFRRTPAPFVPHVHVSESADELALAVELPGLNEKDIALSLERGVLDVRAAREVELPEGFTPRVRERSQFTFEKRFALPEHVDAARLDATMKDGVLTIRLPKAEAAKPKTITVRGG